MLPLHLTCGAPGRGAGVHAREVLRRSRHLLYLQQQRVKQRQQAAAPARVCT